MFEPCNLLTWKVNLASAMQVPGDLDPKVSPRYLTTMKKAYLKLRYLVDSGCIFVGHDLRHDFKSINIIVPPQQVTSRLTGCHAALQSRFSQSQLTHHALSAVTR